MKASKVMLWVGLGLLGMVICSGLVVVTLIAATGKPQATPIIAPVADGVTAVPSEAPKVTPGQLTDGVYKVGTEAKPGTYVAVSTTGEFGCYWARLKSFEGYDIIANGDLPQGARGRFTVKPTDKGLELRGGCTWELTK